MNPTFSQFKISLVSLICCSLAAMVALPEARAAGNDKGKIVGFESELKKGKHGWTIVEVKPSAFEPNAPKNEKMYKIWGVLICWKYNGEQKAKRQDMTRDIMKEGVYEYTLAYSESAKVSDVALEYFDATAPKKTWPKKESCGQKQANTKQPSGSGDSKSTNEYCPGPADERRQPQGSCVEVVRTKRGNHCGSDDSLSVKVRNKCDTRVYARLCMERPGDKSPDCGAFGIKAGGTHSTWTCHGTGEVSIDAVFSPKLAKDWTCADWH